jgi:hypothetical protein
MCCADSRSFGAISCLLFSNRLPLPRAIALPLECPRSCRHTSQHTRQRFKIHSSCRFGSIYTNSVWGESGIGLSCVFWQSTHFRQFAFIDALTSQTLFA